MKNMMNFNASKVKDQLIQGIRDWFEKNGKVYEIGSWDANSNTDYIVKELIQSTDSII